MHNHICSLQNMIEKSEKYRGQQIYWLKFLVDEISLKIRTGLVLSVTDAVIAQTAFATEIHRKNISESTTRWTL